MGNFKEDKQKTKKYKLTECSMGRCCNATEFDKLVGLYKRSRSYHANTNAVAKECKGLNIEEHDLIVGLRKLALDKELKKLEKEVANLKESLKLKKNHEVEASVNAHCLEGSRAIVRRLDFENKELLILTSKLAKLLINSLKTIDIL